MLSKLFWKYLVLKFNIGVVKVVLFHLILSISSYHNFMISWFHQLIMTIKTFSTFTPPIWNFRTRCFKIIFDFCCSSYQKRELGIWKLRVLKRPYSENLDFENAVLWWVHFHFLKHNRRQLVWGTLAFFCVTGCTFTTLDNQSQTK